MPPARAPVVRSATVGADDDLEGRLVAAAEALRVRDLTRQRADELGRRLAELHHHLAGLRQQLAAEHEDVAKLEGLTLTRVVAGIRGDRDDRLSREQAEAHMAALRVQDAEARAVALQWEHDAAEARWRGMDGAPAAYAAALDAKEQHLRHTGDPRASQIMALAQERGGLGGDLRELEEAQWAAHHAHQALVAVADCLRRASGWSTYDTWLGGGALSSHVKHSRLDEAARAAAAADHHLVVLRTELADLGGSGLNAPGLAVDGLTRFVDVWFDNIFTDLSVGNRIRRAQDNVAGALAQVGHLRAQLDDRAGRSRARLDAIAAEREALLTTSP
jgi:hypothetical protein